MRARAGFRTWTGAVVHEKGLRFAGVAGKAEGLAIAAAKAGYGHLAISWMSTATVTLSLTSGKAWKRITSRVPCLSFSNLRWRGVSSRAFAQSWARVVRARDAASSRRETGRFMVGVVARWRNIDGHQPPLPVGVTRPNGLVMPAKIAALQPNAHWSGGVYKVRCTGMGI